MYECQEAVFNVFLAGFIADRSEILNYYRSTGKIHITVVKQECDISVSHAFV